MTSAEVIRKELVDALNTEVPWHSAADVISLLRSTRPAVFSTLSSEASDYVATCLSRHSRRQTFLSPEEFAKQVHIVEVSDVFGGDAPNKRKQKCSSHEIRKSLLSAKAIIPSSYDLRTRFGMPRRSAENLRANLISVLRALADLGLYEHPTLEDSCKFPQLRRKPRE